MLQRAVAISGIAGLCIIKRDVLDGMKTRTICIAYECRGKRAGYASFDTAGWDACTPLYLEFPGWEENIHGVTGWDTLPPAACADLRALEKPAGSPISIFSTGPDRALTRVLEDPFA